MQAEEAPATEIDLGTPHSEVLSHDTGTASNSDVEVDSPFASRSLPRDVRPLPTVGALGQPVPPCFLLKLTSKERSGLPLKGAVMAAGDSKGHQQVPRHL